MPGMVQVSFLVAVLVIWVAKRTVSVTIEDDRTNLITQHACVATLSVFWVIFFLVSIGSVVWEFSRPLGISRRPRQSIFRRRSRTSGASDCCSWGFSG